MIEFALLAACLQHGIEHDLIRAIAKQESLGEQTAFYINKWELGQFKNLSLDDAVLVSSKMVAEGYTVDVGLMGINSRNVKRFGVSIREAFDPCINVNMGEQILFENINQAKSKGHSGEDAIKVALSLYNTGSETRGFTNGYVDKVWANYSTTLQYKAQQADINVPWDVQEHLDPVVREQPAWLSGDGYE